MMGFARIYGAGVAFAVTISLVGALPAAADREVGSGAGSVGAAPGNFQYGEWNLHLRRVKGRVTNGDDFSTDRCMDIKFDWNIPNTGGHHNHYDARVVRNCKPGRQFTSDGTGDSWGDHDGYWVEPENWAGPDSNGVREVVAYMIDDDADTSWLQQYPVLYGSGSPDWYYKLDSNNQVWGSQDDPDRAPVTTGRFQSWFARTYTLRQDGDVQWSSDLSRPITCSVSPDRC